MVARSGAAARRAALTAARSASGLALQAVASSRAWSKACCAASGSGSWLPQEEFAAQPVQFRLEVALVGRVGRGKPVFQSLKALVYLVAVGVHLGEKCKEIRMEDRRPGGRRIFEPASDRGDPGLGRSVLAHGPAANHGRPGAPDRDPVLSRDRAGSLGALAGHRAVAGELSEHGIDEQGVDERERMVQRDRTLDGVAASRDGLVGEAEKPLAERECGCTGDAGLLAVGPDQLAVAGGIVASFDFLEMSACLVQATEEEQGPADRSSCDDDRVIVVLLGQAEEGAGELIAGGVIRGDEVVVPKPVEDRQEVPRCIT